MKKLIIDGNNLIHRTYWTAKSLSKRQNEEDVDRVNDFHTYLTINAVLSYVKTYKPTDVYIVWDARKGDNANTRKEIFNEYKGNRSSDNTPHQNNEYIQFLLEKLNIKSIFPWNLEADDIIAYLCNEPGDNIIVSVDKDFLQLISDRTILYDPIRKKEYNIINFEDQTGCKTVDEWMFEKCMLGDKSDNVSGAITKTKLKKIYDGKYVLTEEERTIFDRNKQLFNLSANIESKEQDIDFYKHQVSQDCKPDWAGFISECKNRKFENLLNKKDEIYSLFFLRNKLISFFTKE
jgi:hypothetical protein